MPAVNTEYRPSALLATLAAGLLVALAAAAACGTDSGGGERGPEGENTIRKVTPSECIYDIEAFRAAGLKANKSYDVADLPGGVAAWHGVFGARDFEVRFYASHEDAVEFGAAPAGHVSGKDGVVSGPDVLWEEGESNRRKCVPSGGLSEAGCLQTARYGDYVIIGNAVVLCEGLDSEMALEACAALLSNLD